jgi:predicted ArsR family transcriptional regulator
VEIRPRQRTRSRPSALGEPTRRAVYDHVVRTGTWVSRDQAADALGLERGTVTHHLDRLAAEGLLAVDYQRLSGRRGPGAGRPAKLYRRAARDFGVSLPPRTYELAARLLASAVAASRDAGVPILAALEQVADAEGERIAQEIRADLVSSTATESDRRQVVLDALERHGYEPRADADGTVELRNCPFHHLAQEHTELVCGMNYCLLRAAVDHVGDTGLDARLEPAEGYCCVKLRSRGRATRS